MFNYKGLNFSFFSIFKIFSKIKSHFDQKFILNIYIFQELLITYVAVFVFLNMVLFVTRLFEAVYWIIELNLPITNVLITLTLYFMIISEYTLPLAMVLSTILTISRFSEDGEIVGMQSSGVSFYKIFAPIIYFGLTVSCFIFIFYQFLLPGFKKEYALSELHIHQINPSGELAKKLFYETIQGDMISIESVNNNKMKNIWVKSMKEKYIIFSPYGYLLERNDERNVFPLILFNAIVSPINTMKSKKDNSFIEYFNAQKIIYIPDQPLHFYIPKSYFYFSLSEFSDALEGEEANIAVQNLMRLNDLQFFRVKYLDKKEEIKKKKYENEIALLEDKIKAQIFLEYIRTEKKRLEEKYMYKNISAYNERIYYFYRQVNLIFSTFAFGILGSSLGVFNKRTGRGRSVSLGLGMIFIALFLAMVFGGNILLQKEVLSPFFAATYFNIFYYLLAGYFFFSRVVDKNSIFKVKIKKWKIRFKKRFINSLTLRY